MTILDRYVTKEFFRLFILILALFISLFLIVDFFERIRMFMSNNATLRQIASFFFYKIPMMISQTVPASILIAALVTFSSLSKNHEIVAMKANGISLYRTALPVIIATAIICVIAFLNSEFITPYGNRKADHIKLVEVQKRDPLGTFKQNQLWYRGKSGIYNFKLFNPKTNTLQGVTVNFLDNDFNLTSRVDAEKAEWREGRWVFHNLLITRFVSGDFPAIEYSGMKVIDLPETPLDFNVVQEEADNMGFADLRRYIKKIQSEGYDATRYLVDMYGKTAYTLVSIILVIIGISFSLMRTERSGGVMQSIGVGIIIGFSYWIFHAFAMSLGRSGTLPPIVAAWLTNFIFFIASAIMFRRVKT